MGTALFPKRSPFPHPVHLDEGSPDLSPLAGEVSPATRVALVAPAGLERALAPALAAARRAFPRSVFFPLRGGERHKSRAAKERLEDAMLAAGFGRDALVVAVGGGVLTDLAGFTAGTYLRGVPWAACPSSLLGMVDASLGGKTGVNTPSGKNLVGLIHPPVAVIIGLGLLATLPAREWRNGLAECLKHGLTSDADYFDFVAGTPLQVFRAGGTPLVRLVSTSIRLKGAVVKADPLERSGARFLLNAGHTVGHALEALSGWRIPHGAAVASGLLWEAAVSAAEGRLPLADLEAVRAATAFHGFADAWARFTPEEVLDAARTDKKNRAGSVRFVPLAAIGRPALPAPHTAELTLKGLRAGLRLLKEKS